MTKRKLGSITGKTSPIVVRIGLFLVAFLSVSAYVLSRISDGEVLEVAPYFLFAIALQFIPFFVRVAPEPFEPPGLNSITTLLALVPALTTYVVNDSVQINLLPQVSGRTRIELVQTVMVAYMVGTLSYLGGYYVGIGRRITGIFPDLAGGTWRRSRIIHVSLVAAALFLPAYAYFQARVGASLTDITKLAAGKAVWREDATLFIALADFDNSLPCNFAGLPGDPADTGLHCIKARRSDGPHCVDIGGVMESIASGVPTICSGRIVVVHNWL